MPTSSNRFWWAFILCGCVVILGWQLFLFTTDDAYIIFRYVGQRQAGFGYVWNTPPFQPVEGYSCFGWLVLLDVVSSLFSLAPAEVANPLLLLATLGSLFVILRFAWRVGEGESGGFSFLLWTALSLVTSRLFLTWSSSGLETALFNFLVLLWLYKGAVGGWAREPNAGKAILFAVLLSLVRPDGYLFLAASLGWYALESIEKREGIFRARWWLALSPVALVLAHLLWRRSFYGEWLPNTYYAKVVGPLPDIGLRYLLSFIIEHGVYLLLPVIFWASLKSGVFKFRMAMVGRWVAVMTLLMHTLYYVVVAGGDHFEYRILSHWSPLMAVGGTWAVFHLSSSRITRIGGLLLLWLCTHTLPWIHFGVSQEHTEWSRQMPEYPIEKELPPLLQPAGAHFDELQQWLFRHGVGMRHQHHKLFSEHQLTQLPSQTQAVDLLQEQQNPVVVVTSAGIAGWVFLHSHVLDVFGLNDYVVARTPPRSRESARVVAHSRQPPAGYVEAFRPNMIVTPSRVSPVRLRQAELSDAEIIEVEQRFRAELPEDRNTPMTERME